MTRAAAATLRGLVGIAAAGRRRVSASVQGRGASPGWRGFRAVAPGSGGRTTPEPSSSSTPALPQLQPRRVLATRQTVLPGLISGGCESEDGKLSCGYSSFKGRRPTMEDRYDMKFANVDGQTVSLLGVFDGHAGPLAADYLKENLLDNVMKHPQFLENPKLALKTTFLKTDADFLEAVSIPYRQDGSTALAAVLISDQLYVANVGDSRAIALKGGKAISLSDDHKPNRKDEQTRIENAGGSVSYDGYTWRVDGILAMSRAFGNRALKKYVIAEPDFQEAEVNSDFEFLVLATDGLWDVVRNEDCIGAIDGTHVTTKVLRSMSATFRGRKHYTRQNVLSAVDFDMRFTDVLAGWEGSAHDASILADNLSRPDGLQTPEGKLYLGDARYACRPDILPPFKKTRYRLNEFSLRHRPQNAKELFNLRHSSLRVTIERAFAALKNRFKVLDQKPFHTFDIQVKFVLACCILYNWILGWSEDEFFEEVVTFDEVEIGHGVDADDNDV
ncbi:hypothetical protein QYE76_034141 [Lolium multiflorum]|uniref:protein-serine/threonine phosphatase n=1 Tax=Lolium multiflorum TaxID=4521 RepID=A0AAD8R0G7_LOLMU|nr:hypothetical protein QYE76_034141 [Lolium multiflorum]